MTRVGGRALRAYRFVIGPLRTNCYLLVSDNEDVIVDPGHVDGLAELYRQADRAGVRVKAVVATHGHFDHVLGAKAIIERFKAPFLISELDLGALEHASHHARVFLGVRVPCDLPRPDGYLREGSTIEIGSERLTIIETPGHTAGSICIRCGNIVLTGDTLFYNSIGRVDLPGSVPHLMPLSIKRLVSLPEETKVLPGHGRPTTIGWELKNNRLLRSLLESTTVDQSRRGEA